ncbi:MAG TPA: polysaccharide deacetylase family protein [Methylomirabilota bacterium]|nr:polysaccharide deacetylase family protein [Methylomirabilota bacterium]
MTRGSRAIWRSLLCLGVVAMVAWGCASTAPPAAPPPTPVVTGPPPPEVFESPDFIVVIPKTPETSASLAAKYLGDAAKAWMIEEFTGAGTFAPGQQAVIPRKAWNPAGVTASGYRLVPILVYHNLDAQPKGKLVQSAASFDAQMRYLKTEGYHTLTLAEFLDFTRLNRQLPRKSVVLTFDDGYKSFKQYAYPVLKELGFTATLFVYTDYVGAGRNALSWADIKALQAEGFDIQAHSKTHGDLRRAPGESTAQFDQRMHAELAQPRELFKRQLGQAPDTIAYPYGRWDNDVLRQVKATGYVAAFTVRRQGNPAFVSPLTIHRSQIYADMSLEDFAKNLTLFQEEDLR